MAPPNELLFGVGFCIFATIVCSVRAYREKEKMYYIGSVSSFLMLLVIVLLILNQRLIATVLFASAGIFAIVTLPISLRFYERKSVKLTQADLSAPMRGRELLTNKGISKYAVRWGVWKTVLVYWLLMVGVLGGVLYFLSSWVTSLSIDYIASYTITISTLFTMMLYRQIIKVKEEYEISNGSTF